MESNMTCTCEEKQEGCTCEDEGDQQTDRKKPIRNDPKCTCDECICEVDPDADFLSNGDLIY